MSDSEQDIPGGFPTPPRAQRTNMNGMRPSLDVISLSSSSPPARATAKQAPMQQRRPMPVTARPSSSTSPSPLPQRNPPRPARNGNFRDAVVLSDSEEEEGFYDSPARAQAQPARRTIIDSDSENEPVQPRAVARPPVSPAKANQPAPVVRSPARVSAPTAPAVHRLPINQARPSEPIPSPIRPPTQQIRPTEPLPATYQAPMQQVRPAEPNPPPYRPPSSQALPPQRAQADKEKALPARPEPLQDHHQPRAPQPPQQRQQLQEPYNPYTHTRNQQPYDPYGREQQPQQPYNPYTRDQLHGRTTIQRPEPEPYRAPGIPLPSGIARTLNVGPTRPYAPPQKPPSSRPPVAYPSYSAYSAAAGSAGNPITIPSNPPASSRSNPYSYYSAAPVNPPPRLPSSSQGSGKGSYSGLNEDDVVETYTSPEEAQKALQDLFSSAVGDAEIEGVDMERDSRVEGFRDTIVLMPHQVKGRMWMRGREEGKARGGILADDMGLGKTIQTFTRIVDGKRTDDERKDGYARATLIVCPVGLIKQWADELQKMTVGLRVIEHHGSGRAKDPKVLERADVVITSYSVVSSEHGAFKGPDETKKAKKPKAKSKNNFIVSDSEDGSDSEFAKKVVKRANKRTACPLFEVDWLRVVLDEAQNIKNKSAKMSIGCCELEAKFRWCLTGTPIQNSVDDLYPLLKFLGIKPLNDWTQFRQHISQPVKAGKAARPMKRLQVILKVIMLRRTKTDQVNGQPLLKLPPREVRVVQCDFDEDEREFYKALQERTTLTFNKFLKRGDVMKNYTSVLVLLLRMRQACGHPGLVSKDFGEEKDALEPTMAKTDKEEQEVTRQEEDELADLLGKMSVGDGKPAMCKICLEPLPKGDKKTVCEDCDKANIDRIARRQSLAANLPDDDSDASIVAIPRNEAAFPKKPRASGASFKLPPSSAKIRKIIELLNDIAERSDRQEKTIIFSQFTGMLDLVQPFLRHHGIKFSRIDGSLKPTEREMAINKIKNDKSVTVILISFKAGGVGLNLVCCNNVILVDLWWNPALEDQAFDRAHRLGQTRSVNIFKLVIEDTVEDRILTLQDKKREVATVALSGGKLSKNKLELNDLIALFNPASGHDDDDDD